MRVRADVLSCSLKKQVGVSDRGLHEQTPTRFSLAKCVIISLSESHGDRSADQPQVSKTTDASCILDMRAL